MKKPLAKPRTRQLIQLIHGRQILPKSQLLEFRVYAAKIVALKLVSGRIRPIEVPGRRTIAQGGDIMGAAIAKNSTSMSRSNRL